MYVYNKLIAKKTSTYLQLYNYKSTLYKNN